MDNRTIPEVVALILVILLDTKHRGAPSVPRICIIGPPGSGRKVVAKTIAAKFNLVHGNYQYLDLALNYRPFCDFS